MIQQIAREIYAWSAQHPDNRRPSRVRVSAAVMDAIDEEAKRLTMFPVVGRTIGTKIAGVPVVVDEGMTTGVIDW